MAFCALAFIASNSAFVVAFLWLKVVTAVFSLSFLASITAFFAASRAFCASSRRFCAASTSFCAKAAKGINAIKVMNSFFIFSYLYLLFKKQK